jgi:hypothetical protein
LHKQPARFIRRAVFLFVAGGGDAEKNGGKTARIIQSVARFC